VSGDWFSGNLSEPIRKEYGEKRREEHKCNARKKLIEVQEGKEFRNKEGN